MNYEITKKVAYSFRLTDADLDMYLLPKPNDADESEEADIVRDRRTESLDALVWIVMERSVEGQRGVITAYDDIFCPSEVHFDEGMMVQALSGLKDGNLYWCVHYEVDVDEEVLV
jgi:hypothetical protein